MSVAVEEFSDLQRDEMTRTLIRKFEEAKAKEDEWKQARMKAEELLLQLLPKKDEGSVTTEACGYKVTTSRTVRRDVDLDEWLALADDLPPSYRTVVRLDTVGKLDTKMMRAMQQHDPDAYGILARCLTAKPGKYTIKIKDANDGD